MNRLTQRAFVLIDLFAMILAVSCPSATSTPNPQPTIAAVIPSSASVTFTPLPTPTNVQTATPTSTTVPTATFTQTPTATRTHTPTPTPLPQGTLKQDAVLYSGPGNVGYEALAQLRGKTSIKLLGTFVDFAKAQADVDGKPIQGFIWKGLIDTLPSGLRELDVSEVQWQGVSPLSSFVNDHTVFQGDQIRVENTTDEFVDPEGTAIALSGPFMLTVKMQVTGADFGSVKLLGTPEPTTGTWWKGIQRLDVFFYRNSIGLGIRDGTTEGFKTTIPLSIRPGQSLSLVFHDPQGKKFSVFNQDGGETKTVDVTTISGLQMSDGLFPQRRLYLGASSSPRSTLTLSGLSLRFPPTGKLTSVAAKQPGLKDLAGQKGITIGTEYGWWRARDPRYLNLMTKEFNVAILSEFSCDFGNYFWTGRGTYNFEPVDNIVNFTRKQGLRVRASHLIWGSVEAPCGPPEWMAKGSFTRDEYILILQEHVKAVVSHFKGRVTEWSIANEAVSRSMCQSVCDYWLDKIGPEYTEIAFRAAREADPSGVLIFNEANNDSPRDQFAQRVVDKMYERVKELKEKGVPVDVVGMQMHFLLPWDNPSVPNKEEVIKTMRRFAELGVVIYITEMDVNLTNVPGSQQEKWNYEAKIYRDIMAACIESSVCKSFATWGVADSTSWLTCTEVGCVKLPNAEPLMFDKDFQPKPAYNAVLDALQGK